MEIDIHTDSYAIPFNYILEARNFMPYGSSVKVMFDMLFLTGCRLSTLDNMKITNLFYTVFYFRESKTRKYRKEILPDRYLRELKYYRDNNRVYGDKLFGVNSDTFRRYFNRDVRPHLSKAWNIKRPIMNKGSKKLEYVFQLKGLRKDYQTLDFAKQLRKWKDSYVAMQFTSKKMKHSCARITAYHYLENFEQLQIHKYEHLTPAEILKENYQTRLYDFF